MTVFVARSTADKFYRLLALCNFPTLGFIYRPARMVSSDKTDVERQELVNGEVVDVVGVVLVLIPTAEVCVAGVGIVGLCDGVLDRSGNV